MDLIKQNLYESRIAEFIKRVRMRILSSSIQFTAEYGHSYKPTLFNKRLSLKYKKIKEGDVWGKEWESAWFRLTTIVPASWKEKKIVANLNFGSEGLVFSDTGEPLQGLSSGSVYDAGFKRSIYPLINSCKGGENIELWVETAANGLFGTDLKSDHDDRKINGTFRPKIKSMRICIFDEIHWRLWLEANLLAGIAKTMPQTSVRRARLTRGLIEAAAVYLDNPENGEASCKKLASLLNKPANASTTTAVATGHAHIDTGWLWPVRETIRKCARTFSTQIALLDKYPEYIFGASQAQHYAFIKEHYPGLYDKIRTKIKEGRWEVQGGMWVEADCNLISGESMVRQFIHGKNYFFDEFGIDIKNLWIPDVFGYSAAMPQIMKKAGVDYFLTQKISWNQFNKFPHHTFKWKGIDGTEILTHFPPEDTYNSTLAPEGLIMAQDNFAEKDFLDEFLCLFGIGDGGGGPKEEYIEMGLLQKDLEGTPKVKFGRVDDFFDRINKHSYHMETWSGELYLELHRGTLTTQGRVKKWNRKLEYSLKEVEFLGACTKPAEYPREILDAQWKTLLRNQFHDIIPGSSIAMVYEDSHREYKEISSVLRNLRSNLAAKLFKPDPDSIVLMNTLSCRYTDPIVLPESWKNRTVLFQEKPVKIQQENEAPVLILNIEPYSFITLTKGEELTTDSVPAEQNNLNLVLENKRIRYKFTSDGKLQEAFDKETDTEVLSKEGNVLSLYEDRPVDYDAWDVDIFYEDCLIENQKGHEWSVLCSGSVRQGIEFRITIGQSTIIQKVYLGTGSKRLDFVTEIDWKERHKMLRVSFPTNIDSDRAAFDIQYGYVYRNTHRNTSWDMAKFEVAGHNYADISSGNYGAALLNDCKYGYKVHNNILDLNLLRSPSFPDPTADIGLHTFTYSFLPHKGNHAESDVIEQGMLLNENIRLYPGYKADNLQIPAEISGIGISMAVLKRGEKCDNIIIRVVEQKGKHTKGITSIKKMNAVLEEIDLLEKKINNGITLVNGDSITLKPFEIKTFILTDLIKYDKTLEDPA